MNQKRKDWADYFLDVAELVASRATCTRAKVGAVIVRDHRILATGYNGSGKGKEHCIDPGVGCLIEVGADGEEHCIRTIHAEVNAIGQAAAMGVAVAGATAYIYSSKHLDACPHCHMVMEAAGVTSIVVRKGEGETL